MLSQVLRREGLPRSAARTPLAVALAWVMGASSAVAQAPAHPQQPMPMPMHMGQHQHPAAPASPASPSQLHYTSVIQDYKPHADPAAEPWREANDRVGRIGGWRAYAREIQGSEPSKGAPAAGSHEGHSAGPRP